MRKMIGGCQVRIDGTVLYSTCCDSSMIKYWVWTLALWLLAAQKSEVDCECECEVRDLCTRLYCNPSSSG